MSPREINAERRLKRRRVVAAEFVSPPGLTYLEARSVKQPTINDYTRRYQELVRWLEIHQIWIQTAEQMDNALIDFLQEMFDAGRGVNDGVRVVAAVKFFVPQLCAGLARTSRGLRGWHLAAPPQQRMPIPIEVLMAVMGRMLNLNEVELAIIRLFVQFMTYMRPGECSQLLVKQLVAPQTGSGQTFQFWAILLHPAEDLIPGKTGVFDASVILDSDIWMYPILNQLKSRNKPSQPLWNQSHQVLREKFSEALGFLKLEPLGLSLYALRHGGASHDVLSRRRSMLEVKQRGRWSSDTSLKRYVKEARLQTELSKVPTAVKEYGRTILQNLPQFLMNPTLAPKAPGGTIR